MEDRQHGRVRCRSAAQKLAQPRGRRRSAGCSSRAARGGSGELSGELEWRGILGPRAQLLVRDGHVAVRAELCEERIREERYLCKMGLLLHSRARDDQRLHQQLHVHMHLDLQRAQLLSTKGACQRRARHGARYACASAAAAAAAATDRAGAGRAGAAGVSSMAREGRRGAGAAACHGMACGSAHTAAAKAAKAEGPGRAQCRATA